MARTECVWLASLALILTASCSSAEREAAAPHHPTTAPTAGRGQGAVSAGPSSAATIEGAAADTSEAGQVSQTDAPAPTSSETLSTAPHTGPDQPLEITFVGDVMFGRYVEGGRKTIPAGDYDLFAPVADLIRAPIAVANLETPVLGDLPDQSPYGLRLRFGATPAEVDHLVRAGITAVTLANNHSYDLRHRGLLQTPLRLAELGLAVLGRSWPESPVFRVDTIEHQGWRVGFIGITTERNGPQRAGQPVLPYVDSAKEIAAALIPVITAARRDHHLVVVLAHWGEEYLEEPWKSQVAAGHALIDAGADLVIGHHPHVLQGFERYHDGLIAYSLGNFRFDNARATQKLSGVLRLRYGPGHTCPDRVVLHPVHMAAARIAGASVYRPEPATGVIGERVRRRVIAKSDAMATRWQQAEASEDLELITPCASANADTGANPAE